MEKLFFDGFDGLLRVAVSAPVVYLSIVAFIRISGKRSTSQMNNFDWIVTVAMGSLAASGIILKDVTLAEVLLAIALLLALQYVLTLTVLHSETAARTVKAEPALLLDKGRFLTASMRRERITEEEVLSAVRQAGIWKLDDVQWVVLETDASFSIIPTSEEISVNRASAVRDVPAIGQNNG